MRTYKRTNICVSKPRTPKVVLPHLTPEQVNKEYGECRVVERKLEKKYKAVIDARRKTTYTLSNLQWIVNHLCDRLGSRKPKVACVQNGLCHYDYTHIVMTSWSGMFHEYCISVLLHELAHHIVSKEKGMKGRGGTSGCHSGDFLWVLEMLWDMWYGDKK